MNATTRGLFVVFEGLDGSGKTTQLERLAARLEAAGRAVTRTREPYDCEAGRRIRAMAQSGEAVSAEQELAWFWEQREEHVRDVIEPALADGRIVLCDRYYLSTVAYQGARGLDAETLLADSEAAFPTPDLVLWLDLPVTQGLTRVDDRGGTAEPVFEDAERLEAARGVYAALTVSYLARIDAAGDPDEVTTRIADTLRERLGLVV